jgi:hypothetical protein
VVTVDLTQPVSFRGQSLNSWSLSGGIILGNVIERMDVSRFDLRQFQEPLALVDGIDVGGSWLGGRHVLISGSSFGSGRGATFDLVEALAAVMIPESGAFGYYDLTWYQLTAGGLVLKHLSCRPLGLMVPQEKSNSTGNNAVPMGQLWSVAMFAHNPAIT